MFTDDPLPPPHLSVTPSCTARHERVNRYGQYTWIVSIGLRDGTHLQSGILVADRWVLTNRIASFYPGMVVRIVDDRLDYTAASLYAVTSIVPGIHPNICLVAFENSEDACLPRGKHARLAPWNTCNPSRLVAIGWNVFIDADTNTSFIDLNELDIPSIAWGEDGEMYGGYADCAPDTVYCNVDIGSPLLARDSDGDHVAVVGISDPTGDTALEHTNQGRWIPISALIPWINSVVVPVEPHRADRWCIYTQMVIVWAVVILLFIVFISLL